MGTDLTHAPITEHTDLEAPQQEVEAPVPEAPAPVRQPLLVGRADDPAESSADRMADQALSRLYVDQPPPEPDHTAHQPAVRRSVVPGSGPEGGALDERTTARITARAGGGRPMAEPVRRRMESAFGRSFSSVRVHDDSGAAELSSAISARAFTSGRDIFLGSGIDTSTASGEHVLAHELAHVVQNGSRSAAPIHRWFGKSKSSKKQEEPKQEGDKRGGVVLEEEKSGGSGGSGGRPRSGITIGGNRGGSRGKSSPQGPQGVGGGEEAKDDLIIIEDEPGKDAPSGEEGKDKGKAPTQTRQEGLAEDARKAFDTAKRFNNLAYAGYEEMVATWVTQGQQKQIVDVSSWSKRAGGDADKRNLKDLLRAFILGQYVAIIGQKMDKPNVTPDGDPRAPKPAERKLFQDKYFPKTLKNRDKWKGLIDKGPYAPETQTWLLDAGFERAIERTPDQRATDGGGPKVDVRSTFIGSEILGAPRRMHLFIVYTASNGEQVYFRGGPGGGAQGGNDQGWTKASIGRYDHESIDWDPSAPSVTVAVGDEARDALDTFYRTARQIDGMKVPYTGNMLEPNKGGLGGLEALITGENCNATVWTLLEQAGLPKKKPSGLHPGWGHKLGALTNPEKVGQLMRSDLDDQETAAKIAGPPTATKNVFHDRGLKERMTILQGGTNITVLQAIGTTTTKIRFGPGRTVAFVHSQNVHIPPPKVVRKFWTTTGSLVRITSGGDTVTDAGQLVEVLDDDWVPGKEGDVKITFKNEFGQSFTGLIKGERLTDKDPKAPPKIDGEDDKVGGDIEPEKPEKVPDDEDVKDKRFEDNDVDSDDESSDEDLKDVEVEDGDKRPVIETFTARVGSVPMFNKDGSRHRWNFAPPGFAKKVGATGVRHKLGLNKVMVQFVVDGEYAWMPEKTWIKSFAKPYPGGLN